MHNTPGSGVPFCQLRSGIHPIGIPHCVVKRALIRSAKVASHSWLGDGAVRITGAHNTPEALVNVNRYCGGTRR